MLCVLFLSFSLERVTKTCVQAHEEGERERESAHYYSTMARKVVTGGKATFVSSSNHVYVCVCVLKLMVHVYDGNLYVCMCEWVPCYNEVLFSFRKWRRGS